MTEKTKKSLQRIFAVVLLLAIWQVAAMLLNKRILLCSPVDVFLRLLTIWKEDGFFASVWFSLRKITVGYLLAFVLGVFLAVLAGKSDFVEILLRPIMVTIKSVPVASFIIIALVWLTSRQLSVFISFLIVLPVIYNNVLAGIRNVDPKMMQMAELFHLPFKKRFLFIWLPAIKPHLISGVSIALGMAWKSGVAAEVIGIPAGSIGERLYEAKAYLNTVDLFAWTVVIVLVSILFENLFLSLLRLFYRWLETLLPFKVPSESPSMNTIESPAEVENTAIPAESDGICIRGLCKSFGENHVLQDLNLDLPAGKVTCIMGPSGCGKTTLFRILMGFEPADAGEITGLPSRISAVFQEDRLTERFSVLTNILLPMEPESAEEAAGLKDKALNLLKQSGLDISPEQKVSELSGGMKRRVTIIRALMPESDLLYLDEPLKGLDEENRNSVIAVLKSYHGTILMITHDAEEAEAVGVVGRVRHSATFVESAAEYAYDILSVESPVSIVISVCIDIVRINANPLYLPVQQVGRTYGC